MENQAYFVAPLIEKVQKISLKSIENLEKEILKNFQ